MQKIHITPPLELKDGLKEMSPGKTALFDNLINEWFKDFFNKNSEAEIDLLLRDVSVSTSASYKINNNQLSKA